MTKIQVNEVRKIRGIVLVFVQEQGIIIKMDDGKYYLLHSHEEGAICMWLANKKWDDNTVPEYLVKYADLKNIQNIHLAAKAAEWINMYDNYDTIESHTKWFYDRINVGDMMLFSGYRIVRVKEKYNHGGMYHVVLEVFYTKHIIKGLNYKEMFTQTTKEYGEWVDMGRYYTMVDLRGIFNLICKHNADMKA